MEEKDKRGRRNFIINMILLVVLFALLISFILAKYVVTPMRVSGASMDPTLKDGQIVLMHKTDKVTYGDIVVYKHDDKLVVKRLIGMSGDRIYIADDGSVYRNGDKLDEPYLQHGATITNPFMRDITVGEGEYYFLGDNRDQSKDSEDYGTVKADTLLGRLLV